MRFWLGWLILLPFAGAWWLAIKIIDVCIKKGGATRLLGILFCLIVSGVSIVAGYFIGPIVGWVIMAVGGLIIFIGIWRSLVVTKPQVEQEEFDEMIKKQLDGKPLGKPNQEKWENMWSSAKEEAKNILKQDKINNPERFSLVHSTLGVHANDSESNELFQRLGELEWKSTIEEAKKILEFDEISTYNKKEWEKFNLICYELWHKRDIPQAKELWVRLQELKDNTVRNRKGGRR